MNEIDGMLT
jgi:hypothetical protein